MKPHLILLLCFAACPAFAGERASINYTIVADTIDLGGGRAASANYSHDGSAGSIAGLSTVAAPIETVKHGYVGQLYELTSLALNAAAPTVNEAETLQLGAWLALDDATFLAVPAESVTWSVAGGPLDAISTAGLATAGLVFADTPATVQGVRGTFSGTFDLTVLDTLADNFGAYAADGIGDDWQVQYFGFDNPNAAPAIDADGDGEDNRFEWIAGLIPIDPASHFNLRITPDLDQPALKKLTFSPRLEDRTYDVIFKTNLADPDWLPLSDGLVNDNGEERIITDPDSEGQEKFYRVIIGRP